MSISRYRRFAAVIHLMRWAADDLTDLWGEGAIDEEDVRRAVLLADYFKSHALAVYQLMRQSDEDKSVEALNTAQASTVSPASKRLLGSAVLHLC